MATNRYSFTTALARRGAAGSGELGGATNLPRWWPSVYLEAKELAPGQPGTQVGRTIALRTRGWLPYTLRWNFRVTDNRHPHGFSFEASGDFEGTGVWTFEPEEGGTHARFDWNIVAEKPLLKYLSFVMKPIFRANREWAMRRGEESLAREIERRRGQPQ